MTSKSFIGISACSYEGSLFGWELIDKQEKSDRELDIALKYGFSCCQNSLKSIAISSSGKFLVCGGTDERIRIFDNIENKSLGELSNHQGAITTLQFFGDTHLLSGSEASMPY
jgi:protein MAK11